MASSISLLPPSLPLLLIYLLLSSSGTGGKPPLPSFSVSWPDDKSTFQAGDEAMIKVRPWGDSTGDLNDPDGKYVMEFSVEVRGKKGNSSFISGVHSCTEGDPVHWNIAFIPIMVGEFTAVVTEENSGMVDTTLHFSVQPGDTHPPSCITWWMNDMNEFVAGSKATAVVALQDAFGNNSTLAQGDLLESAFTVEIYYENGSISSIPKPNYIQHEDIGQLDLEFDLFSSGFFLLHVMGNKMMLRGSPQPFKVKPGPIVVGNCIGKWKYGINTLQIFSQLEFLILQRDQFGNLVPGSFMFDAQVIKRETDLSIPVPDMVFSQIDPGLVLLSFAVSEPGDFILVISDGDGNANISNAPHNFVVFVGYCHGLNSMINGSGIFTSTVGLLSYFTVYLKDMYQNPSPIEAERLHVDIIKEVNSINLQADIFPLYDVNGSTYSPISHNQNAHAKLTLQTSAFNVTFRPEKAGTYQIWVLCGNIVLNNGQPFSMTVFPGMVDKSASRVINFIQKVKRLVKNKILVHLIDYFGNPVPSNEAKLSFKFDVANRSSFLTWSFVNEMQGLYSGHYLAREIGTFKVCIMFEDVNLSPSPFEISIYPSEYFPEAHDDSVSAWEDGSVAFDVLGNDFYAGNASIISSSMPFHGSLLQYGSMFRYTPYKGISGNDSFWYTISDMHNNLASGKVQIAVLSLPPQFVFLPDYLTVTEDVISPQFGGFQGFLLRYSDVSEVINVTVGAQFGTVMLAPMPFELWQSPGNNISISNGEMQTFMAMIFLVCMQQI